METLINTNSYEIFNLYYWQFSSHIIAVFVFLVCGIYFWKNRFKKPFDERSLPLLYLQFGFYFLHSIGSFFENHFQAPGLLESYGFWCLFQTIVFIPEDMIILLRLLRLFFRYKIECATTGFDATNQLEFGELKEKIEQTEIEALKGAKNRRINTNELISPEDLEIVEQQEKNTIKKNPSLQDINNDESCVRITKNHKKYHHKDNNGSKKQHTSSSSLSSQTDEGSVKKHKKHNRNKKSTQRKKRDQSLDDDDNASQSKEIQKTTDSNQQQTLVVEKNDNNISNETQNLSRSKDGLISKSNSDKKFQLKRLLSVPRIGSFYGAEYLKRRSWIKDKNLLKAFIGMYGTYIVLKLLAIVVGQCQHPFSIGVDILFAFTGSFITPLFLAVFVFWKMRKDIYVDYYLMKLEFQLIAIVKLLIFFTAISTLVVSIDYYAETMHIIYGMLLTYISFVMPRQLWHDKAVDNIQSIWTFKKKKKEASFSTPEQVNAQLTEIGKFDVLQDLSNNPNLEKCFEAFLAKFHHKNYYYLWKSIYKFKHEIENDVMREAQAYMIFQKFIQDEAFLYVDLLQKYQKPIHTILYGGNEAEKAQVAGLEGGKIDIPNAPPIASELACTNQCSSYFFDFAFEIINPIMDDYISWFKTVSTEAIEKTKQSIFV